MRKQNDKVSLIVRYNMDIFHFSLVPSVIGFTLAAIVKAPYGYFFLGMIIAETLILTPRECEFGNNQIRFCCKSIHFKRIATKDLDNIEYVETPSALFVLLQTKGVPVYGKNGFGVIWYALSHPFRVKMLYIEKVSLISKPMPRGVEQRYRSIWKKEADIAAGDLIIEIEDYFESIKNTYNP